MFTHTILHSRRSLTSFAMSLASRQGHIEAASLVGTIYSSLGQGAAVDYSRSMAAFTVCAEGGNADCQFMVGTMYYNGLGADVDYKQARTWLEKAAAQDDPDAVHQLGQVHMMGDGVHGQSFRRAREYTERAMKLGNLSSAKSLQSITKTIQKVTSWQSNHVPAPSLVRDVT